MTFICKQELISGNAMIIWVWALGEILVSVTVSAHFPSIKGGATDQRQTKKAIQAVAFSSITVTAIIVPPHSQQFSNCDSSATSSPTSSLQLGGPTFHYVNKVWWSRDWPDSWNCMHRIWTSKCLSNDLNIKHTAYNHIWNNFADLILRML